MSLSRKEVEHIAALARLDLTEDEINLYQVQLSAILDHIRQLSMVDTSHTPLNAFTVDGSRLRADEVLPSLPTEEVLGNARHVRNTQFRVPGIFKDTDV